jgi:hypothetical protein
MGHTLSLIRNGMKSQFGDGYAGSKQCGADVGGTCCRFIIHLPVEKKWYTKLIYLIP